MKSKFFEMHYLSIGDMERRTFLLSVSKMTSDPRLQSSCQNSLIFEKEKQKKLKRRVRTHLPLKKRKEVRIPTKKDQEGHELERRNTLKN